MEKTLRILVVDDNPDDRVLIKRELSREFPNLQVTEVADAQALALALAGDPFHLAITDYQLGWNDGLAILRDLKARWPHCPVVMFTGTGSEEIAVEAMKNGLEDYVLKTPRHYIRLVASVRKALKRTKERLALLAAEDRYRRLFNNAPIGLYRITPLGEIVEANPSLVHLLGYPDREALLAVRAVDFYVDPVDKQRWQDQMQRRGEVRGFELQLRQRDGSAIWVRNHARMVRDEKGEIWCYEGSLEDLTARRQAEERLRNEKQFSETLLETIPSPVFYKDTSGRYLGCNRAFEEFFGKPRDEIIGKDVYEMGPWEIADKYAAMDRELLERPGIQMYEWKVRNAEGLEREVIFHKASLSDVAGKAVGLIGILLDITDRKQAEEALRASEERYRTVADYTYDMEYWVDPERIIRYMSPACERLTGYPAQTFVDDPQLLDRIVHPEDRARFIKHREEAISHSQVYDLEFRLIHRNGSEHWVNHTCQPVYGADGSPLGRRVSNRDITQRKLAEEAFHSLVSSAPMGIYIVQDGKFVMINPGFEVITGYRAQELIGQNCLTPVSPEYRAFVREQALQRLKGEGLSPYEYQFIAKDGETGWVMETVTPTQYHGKRAVLGYFMDITPLKKLETQFLQAQKMESVGRLAGGVAHDFNNMLGVIIGHAEMAMMQVSTSEPLHQSLQEIRNAAQRSADLTRQLLAFARKQTVQPQVLDLNDTVAGMLKMLQRLIGEDIDLVWMPGHDLWKVKIDPSQIDQILANLAVNARDAIAGVGKLTIETDNVVLDDGTIALTIRNCVSGEYVLLAVSDNGCGMDKETLAHIFEPFFTTKGVGEGTGLGLATVYGIVKQNDGFINVYSEPGHGTTFKIYLPRFEAEAAQAQAETAAKPLQRGTETVLLVEDEEAILDIGQAILEELGYTVLTAGTPGEAIRLAGEYAGDIHLLITDVVMPEMNGRELAERLTAMKPGLKCLYMSGYTADVIAHRGVLDEGVHFIQKPFSMKDLAAKVREVLEG